MKHSHKKKSAQKQKLKNSNYLSKSRNFVKPAFKVSPSLDHSVAASSAGDLRPVNSTLLFSQKFTLFSFTSEVKKGVELMIPFHINLNEKLTFSSKKPIYFKRPCADEDHIRVSQFNKNIVYCHAKGCKSRDFVHFKNRVIVAYVPSNLEDSVLGLGNFLEMISEVKNRSQILFQEIGFVVVKNYNKLPKSPVLESNTVVQYEKTKILCCINRMWKLKLKITVSLEKLNISILDS